MDFREMKYIIEMAKCKSMSEAARQLYVPQPTLSNALKRVEEEINQPLFNRTATGLELTASGKRYIELAQQTLSMLDKIHNEMLMMDSKHEGMLKIGVCSCWAECLMPRVLPDLRSAFSGITAEIVSRPSSLLEKMLLDNEIDVSIMSQPKDTGSLNCEVLFEEDMLIAISPLNPLGSRRTNAFFDAYSDFPVMELANQAFILPPEGHMMRKYAETFFNEHNIPYTISVVCSNLQATKLLATRNLGIGFIPERFAKITMSQHDPLYFSAREITPKWPVIIATQKNNGSAAVDYLIKLLKKVVMSSNF